MQHAFPDLEAEHGRADNIRLDELARVDGINDCPRVLQLHAVTHAKAAYSKGQLFESPESRLYPKISTVQDPQIIWTSIEGYAAMPSNAMMPSEHASTAANGIFFAWYILMQQKLLPVRNPEAFDVVLRQAQISC